MNQATEFHGFVLPGAAKFQHVFLIWVLDRDQHPFTYFNIGGACAVNSTKYSVYILAFINHCLGTLTPAMHGAGTLNFAIWKT